MAQVRGRVTVAVAGSLAALLGCATAERHPPPAPGGLVYLFPGVSGGGWQIGLVRAGLVEGGVTAEIRALEWNRPAFDILGQLQNAAANRQQAAETAGEIAAFLATHPGATVDLVGYSAGGGLALLTVEALPPDVRVRHVILAQAAVNPNRDLTAVLEHIDGRLVNYYCPSDWLVLGVGTELFGTVERVQTASAGKDGFNLARAAPVARLREKVVQQPWKLAMVWAGHVGNHTGMLTPAWNRAWVAPYLRGAAPPG